MKDKHSKNARILDMYVRLCEGRVINKAEEANRFGVDERSIQRDIDDIRAFLDERAVSDSGENRTIEYNRVEKGFVMCGGQSSLMSNSEILAVSKVLLESRAFTKSEIGKILDKMIAGCVPEKNMKMVSDLLANEKYHYVELKHRKKLQDLIWDLGEDIQKLRRVTITYEKQGRGSDKQKYVIEPVGLLFSEYYFYLNAYIVEQDVSGEWQHKYEYPAVFRLDRICHRKDTGEKFRMLYHTRFEEGEFRKRIQFMYAGKLIQLRIRYLGNSVEAILDRLPTAKIISEQEDGVVIDAEVYGTGIIMWLLSQGKNVEVLQPEFLKKEMRNILTEMLKYYQ